ncbi:MAG: amino acid kinase family protein [Candidatus Heimdallarchaeota archaeon]
MITHVVKFGGSLTEKGSIKQISKIAKAIKEAFDDNPSFLIVPGGGIFAENVRAAQKKYKFSDETAHWLAIHAMDQHALILHYFIPGSILMDYSEIVAHVNNKKQKLSKIPILTVTNFMKTTSCLKHSWDTTSDAIATEITANLHIRKIIFLKDIDGILVDGNLEPLLTATELERLTNSPIDKHTPEILRKNNITGYIINGFIEDRVKEMLLAKKLSIMTKIVP